MNQSQTPQRQAQAGLQAWPRLHSCWLFYLDMLKSGWFEVFEVQARAECEAQPAAVCPLRKILSAPTQFTDKECHS